MLVLALPPVVLLQRSLLHAQLQAAARTDSKTGLLNAAAWQRDAERGSSGRGGSACRSRLLVDIDHFKRVNDTYGHLVGDQLLVGAATTLGQQVRDCDVVGRFGGEEFVAYCPGPGTGGPPGRRAAAVPGPGHRGQPAAADDTVTVTVSAGVAALSVHGEDLIELLAAADLALYRAKELGRDRLPAAFPPGAGPVRPC